MRGRLRRHSHRIARGNETVKAYLIVDDKPVGIRPFMLRHLGPGINLISRHLTRLCRKELHPCTQSKARALTRARASENQPRASRIRSFDVGKQLGTFFSCTRYSRTEFLPRDKSAVHRGAMGAPPRRAPRAKGLPSPSHRRDRQRRSVRRHSLTLWHDCFFPVLRPKVEVDLEVDPLG